MKFFLLSKILISTDIFHSTCLRFPWYINSLMTPPKGNSKINHLALRKTFYISTYTSFSLFISVFMKVSYFHALNCFVGIIYIFNKHYYQLNVQMKKRVKIDVEKFNIVVSDFSIFLIA